MRAVTKSVVVACTLFALAGTASFPARAQATRDEFQRLTSQLQQTPNDTALREKVIKLAQTLQPAPAVPEEARKPFVMGATVLKKAGGPADAAKAVELFTTAINIAPWFADAYYNRAVARETAGQFEAAMADLKQYLVFKLSDQERREAQDKIYALEADSQLATTKKAEEDSTRLAAAAAERERARPTIEGTWAGGNLRFQVVRDGERYAITGGIMLGVKAPITWHARSVVADRQHIQFQADHDNPGIRMHPIELSLSPDGSELTGWFNAPNGNKYSTTLKRVP